MTSPRSTSTKPDESGGLPPTSHTSSFDAEVFWRLHGKKVLLVAGAVLVLAIVAGSYLGYQAIIAHRATRAYSGANSEKKWAKVIARYPGSTAAGNSLLKLGGSKAEQKQFTESDDLFTRFLRDYRNHPLVVNGYAGLAANAEAQRQAGRAIDLYNEITTKFPNSYLAPIAMFNQARLEEDRGRAIEAQRLYETIIQRFPASIIVQIATQEAARLTEKNRPEAVPSVSPAANPATGATVPLK